MSREIESQRMRAGMRHLHTTLSLTGVAIAAVALIPSFGQWLFPRSPDRNEISDERGGMTAPAVVSDHSMSPAGFAFPINGSIPTPLDAQPVAETADIKYPEEGTTVEKFVTVRGTISGLKPGQKAFLCIKSTAFGRLIFPQGELLPDSSGQWSVSAIYASINYEYQTFVATAPNAEAAQLLGDGYNRSYGMRSLPEGSSIIGPVITVGRR